MVGKPNAALYFGSQISKRNRELRWLRRSVLKGNATLGWLERHFHGELKLLEGCDYSLGKKKRPENIRIFT